MLHIFRKDVSMLRWAVLTTPLQFGLWAWAEVAAGGMPWEPANVLRQFIVFAWAFTPSYLQVGESPADHSQNWHTRPIPRGPLLGAKLLFLAAVFHLPYLLACAGILWGKGFAPWHYLGRLMEQQALTAAFMTLPALALASVTKGFGAYCGAGMVLSFTVLGTLFAGGRERGMLLFYHPWHVWWWFALLGVMAMGVLMLQYLHRRTSHARWAGVGSVAVLAALFVFVPDQRWNEMQCRSGALQLSGSVQRSAKAKGNGGWDVYSFPLNAAEGARFWERQLFGWRLRTERGDWLRDTGNAPLEMEMQERELVVRVHPDLTAYREGARVELAASARVDWVRSLGPPMWRRAGASWRIPGLGKCGTILEDGDSSGKFRVYCETPDVWSRRTPVRVHAQDRNWSAELDAENSYVSYSWILPLRRVEILPLDVLAREPERKRWRWEAVRSEVENASLEFQPEQWLGCEVADVRIAGRWDHAAGRFWPVMDKK